MTLEPAHLPKVTHEIRDPVHGFINVLTDERRIIDSRPVQRLRYIHQLAFTHLVYPGTTHRRFEHSLGTMHLASDVFDTVTRQENLTDAIKEALPELSQPTKLGYWRTVLRMAGLCHDIGHVAFSHAAEDLMPEGWSHERLSYELILSEEMRALFGEMTPPIRAEEVARVAVGKGKAPENEEFTLWEEILSEIIVGDAFGADRMDYLLRDSLHAGVEYGSFDFRRLVASLRILPGAPRDATESEEPPPPALGVQRGGLHASEQLLLARYFMFTQMYLHPIRRVYDLHLRSYLRETLDGGRFPVNLENHLSLTDNEVLSQMRAVARTAEAAGHEPAHRIFERAHFKLLYERLPGKPLATQTWSM